MGFDFQNAEGLAAQLAASPDVRGCVAKKMLTYAGGGGPLSKDGCFIAEVADIAQRPGATLRDVIVGIALSPAFVEGKVKP